MATALDQTTKLDLRNELAPSNWKVFDVRGSGHGSYADKLAPSPHCIFHQTSLKSILMPPFRSSPQSPSTTALEHSVDGRGGHTDGVSI